MELKGRIDHTLLKIDSGITLDDFRAGARLVLENGLRAFVVPPNVVSFVVREFNDVKVATVISYPLGCDTANVKSLAVRAAAESGAGEVDIVLNLVSVAGGTEEFLDEAVGLCEVAATAGVAVKLIIETPLLSAKRIREVCTALKPLNFLALKTSTGYAREPTSIEDVRVLSECLGASRLLKASGGIRDLQQARTFISAGADILGTSASARILAELQSEWY